MVKTISIFLLSVIISFSSFANAPWDIQNNFEGVIPIYENFLNRTQMTTDTSDLSVINVSPYFKKFSNIENKKIRLNNLAIRFLRNVQIVFEFVHMPVQNPMTDDSRPLLVKFWGSPFSFQHECYFIQRHILPSLYDATPSLAGNWDCADYMIAAYNFSSHNDKRFAQGKGITNSVFTCTVYSRFPNIPLQINFRHCRNLTVSIVGLPHDSLSDIITHDSEEISKLTLYQQHTEEEPAYSFLLK